MKKIKVIGFDMDYTLVGYNINSLEGLTHNLAAKRLTERFGYPEKVSSLKFDQKRAIVGLVIDRRNGNLLKLSKFGKVKTAYHGCEEINFRERAALYRERVVDLRDPDFESLDTAFAISNGVLFAQLVQLKKEGLNLPGYRQLASDVNKCIDSLHKDGTLKSILKKNFGKYVIKDPGTAQMLERLKTYGKKLMIITNSDYSYTKELLEYSLDPFLKEHKSWREVFDIVITFADKPGFFEKRRRFLKIDPDTGLMSNHEGPVSSGIWQGGWFEDIQNGLNIPGDEFLYLGDHIFGDVVSIKKLCDWRTALVLGGLKEELEAIIRSEPLQEEIDKLMEKKLQIEKQIEQAELTRKFSDKKKTETKAGEKISRKEYFNKSAELEKMNQRISELLIELKKYFNPYWGEIFRAGSEVSHYAEQVERYACIYMTKVSDLLEYSPNTYFRPPRHLLPHEISHRKITPAQTDLKTDT